MDDGLYFTEQHLAVREMVRAFARDEVAPVAAGLDARAEFPWANVKRMGELGLLGVPWPEELGGAGLDLLSYIIGWIGFALLSRPIAEAMGAAPHWPRFIVLWNWCNVVQYLLLVLASVPGLLGAPALVQEAVSLIAIGWALWLEWFAIKLALEVSTLAALGLLGLDLSIGLALTALGQGLLAS